LNIIQIIIDYCYKCSVDIVIKYTLPRNLKKVFLFFQI